MEALETLAFPLATLEVRQDAAGRPVYEGFFPYGREAIRSDRGRVRKERFAPHAFRRRIEMPEADIYFNMGHSFDRPLASKLAGSLELKDTAAGVSFRAVLPTADKQTEWQRDFVSAREQGLVKGLSPGFKVPPVNAVPGAERVIPEPGNPGVAIREVLEANLFEFAAVAMPAYPDTILSARAAFEREARTGEELLRWL